MILLASDFNIYHRKYDRFRRLKLGRKELESNVAQFFEAQNSFFVLTLDKILYRFEHKIEDFFNKMPNPSKLCGFNMMTKKLRDGSVIEKVLEVCTTDVEMYVSVHKN